MNKRFRTILLVALVGLAIILAGVVALVALAIDASLAAPAVINFTVAAVLGAGIGFAVGYVAALAFLLKDDA